MVSGVSLKQDLRPPFYSLDNAVRGLGLLTGQLVEKTAVESEYLAKTHSGGVPKTGLETPKTEEVR